MPSEITHESTRRGPATQQVIHLVFLGTCLAEYRELSAMTAEAGVFIHRCEEPAVCCASLVTRV